jgi:phosphoribosylformylglycinamidine synthase subunit PurL
LTVLLSANPEKISEIEEIADHFNFNVARIGTTGGDRLEIAVYGDTFISAPVAELRALWANSLEAALHNEVTA